MAEFDSAPHSISSFLFTATLSIKMSPCAFLSAVFDTSYTPTEHLCGVAIGEPFTLIISHLQKDSSAHPLCVVNVFHACPPPCLTVHVQGDLQSVQYGFNRLLHDVPV